MRRYEEWLRRDEAASVTEHDDQVALFAWAALAANIDPRLEMLVAIPNGGHRHKAVAARMKAEGLKAGFPDMVLFVPVGEWHGLAIELKYGKNKPTKAQLEWLAALEMQGYKAIWCYGFMDAVTTIEDYLGADDYADGCLE